MIPHDAIDDPQITAAVLGIRMIGRERVEKLGQNRSEHERVEGCSCRAGCPSCQSFSMNEFPSPVDLIAQATEKFPHRPSWDEYFMATAVLLSTRSNCERLHVGCVIVTGGDRRNRIVAAGYNGFLPGTPHVSRLREGREQATVHAEQNAVADAARRGSSVEGCVAYVTHYLCINCAKILAAAGIAEIRYRQDYNNDPLVAPLLADAGVKILQL
jgi:dCMP deaminase